MFDDLLDNIRIFTANLTWFYIFSVFVSLFAVIATTWACLGDDKKEGKGVECGERHSLQSQYKIARQKLAEQKLTPQQRSREKKVEAQQLDAIFKLLQEQSETFQVSSMDQLEDQLKLYRDQ